jgi:hypothetical protein
MRQFRLTVTALGLAVGVASVARADLVTIDFDDLPGMNYISGNPVPSYAVLTNQYAELGILFQNTAVVDLGIGHAITGTNGIGGISLFGTDTYSSHYPQIQFSFWVGSIPGVTDFVSIRGDLWGDSGQSQTPPRTTWPAISWARPRFTTAEARRTPSPGQISTQLNGPG